MIMRKIKYKKYIYKWLQDKKNYIKESTYSNYSNIIFNYIIPFLGNYYIDSLNNYIIQNYILFLFEKGGKDNKGLSLKTIKDILMIIKSSIKKSFYEYNIKPFSLKFNYPKIDNIKKMNILSKEEQNKIVKYILNNINNNNVGILLSLILGIRIGELCALKWGDFDLNNEIISINKTIQRIYIKDIDKKETKIIISSPKTLSSNREIPITKDIIYILNKIKTNNNDYFLSGNNKYIEPRSYRNYFNNLLKKLNIKHYKFHSLRHTFATNCISYGFDYKIVSELLGHSNINTTLNIYVHPKMSQKKECINNLCKNFKQL